MAVKDTSPELWLPQTRLQPPRQREDTVFRPRLDNLLHEFVATHSLTLISAPAGYGKTTLAANLAGPMAALLVAWLTLDREDNNPVIFIKALAAALQKLNPACGAGIGSLLNSQVNPLPQGEQLMSFLINEILETLPEPFVVVLDDLHAVTEQAVYHSLDYLLAHMPWQMRLVVTSRVDPPLALARLRARGQLAELRLADLRFTLDEITTLLNHQLQLNLSTEELHILAAGTEGWPAGLRLLAVSLDRLAPTQRASFLGQLARTNRYVFDFLAEEVLNRQETRIRAFLLETAVLSELTPDLCRAVTNQSDAASTLEELYRRNLFLFALDDAAPFASTTYRYHTLFAQFLRQQLTRERSGEEITEIHLRAARAETNPARAIDFFLAAAAWADAAQMIEQIAEVTFNQGLLDRLSGWIEALPAAVRTTRPWLLYFLGACAWGQGQFYQAQQLLEQALAGFKTTGEERGQGETLVQLSVIYQTSGNFEPGVSLAQQALARPLSQRSQTQLHMAFAWLKLGQGDVQQAQAQLEAALNLAETSGEGGPLQILAMQLRSPFHCLPNGLGLMERLEGLIDRRLPGQRHPWQGSLAALRAYRCLWRGYLDEAVAAAELAWSISDALGGLSWLMVEVGPLLTHLYFLRGDTARVESAFSQFAGLADQYSGWRAAILFPYALHVWSQDRLDEAAQIYVRMHQVGRTYEWPLGPVLRQMLRGLLEIADQNYTAAEQTLREAYRLQQQVPVSSRFNARLLLAYLYCRWRRPEAAVHELSPVLSEYAQAGLPGFILSYGPVIVEPLLDLAQQYRLQPDLVTGIRERLHETGLPRSLHIPDTGAVMTPREVEVLRLLIEGASNKAIAAHLVVSLPTVKTHISRILAKLGVQTRGEAAARARHLHLV